MQIRELEIFTPNLAQQRAFYARTLGLDIVRETSNSVSFQIGHSTLKLTFRKTFSPYHYAINIPANQEEEALAWLKTRVDIIKNEDLEIQYFEFWNAYAVYFYDADGNIGELIARKTLNNTSELAFSKNSLLEICEIGVPTFDIKHDYTVLNDKTGIPIYSGNLERFCAIGDANGLFIMVNKELKKEWFPTQDTPFSSDFRLKFTEQGKDFNFVYENEKLRFI